MLTNENDIVNDQNNETVSETKEMLNENAKMQKRKTIHLMMNLLKF